MTTVIFVKKRCFICNTLDRFADIGMMNIGKPEDLDGRSNDVHRSTIYMLMKRCTSCGYCAPDISKGPPSAAHMIKKQKYRKILLDKTFPETSNTFLCWALIQKEEGAYNEAGKATLFAAWVCDDSREFREQSLMLRQESVFLLQKARERKQQFSKTDFSERMLLLDLMRRCGMFEAAQKICDEELKKDHTEKDQMILTFQEDLLARKDQEKHTITEAMAN